MHCQIEKCILSCLARLIDYAVFAWACSMIHKICDLVVRKTFVAWFTLTCLGGFFLLYFFARSCMDSKVNNNESGMHYQTVLAVPAGNACPAKPTISTEYQLTYDCLTTAAVWYVVQSPPIRQTELPASLCYHQRKNSRLGGLSRSARAVLGSCSVQYIEYHADALTCRQLVPQVATSTVLNYQDRVSR